MTSFDDFIDELRAEAEQEGPEAVAEFEALESGEPALSDDEQDTFAGYAERDPMLVSELLDDLGVADRHISDQLYAVLEWWQHHKDTANRMLLLAVERWVNDANGERLEAAAIGRLAEERLADPTPVDELLTLEELERRVRENSD